MRLNELITARVSGEMVSKIKVEVKRRKLSGQRVNQADIVREALIAHFSKSQKTS
jgi:hypothetical protein